MRVFDGSVDPLLSPRQSVLITCPTAQLVDIVATGKTHNISRPATEALSQLVGRISENVSLERLTGKGKGRADERQDDFRYLGIVPLFPAMREAPGFLQSLVKRIDTSDLEMGSKR
jgi:hypothetical protein